ncbi:hypothetical protein ACWAWH_000275, partial [Salmonella enterica subsp. enterica serovar Montevideo]|nr:hypothetical protein [Salmonella enterica]EBJ5999467.1 hypothetical protein [Salmonella enterica]
TFFAICQRMKMVLCDKRNKNQVAILFFLIRLKILPFCIFPLDRCVITIASDNWLTCFIAG